MNSTPKSGRYKWTDWLTYLLTYLLTDCIAHPSSAAKQTLWWSPFALLITNWPEASWTAWCGYATSWSKIIFRISCPFCANSFSVDGGKKESQEHYTWRSLKDRMHCRLPSIHINSVNSFATVANNKQTFVLYVRRPVPRIIYARHSNSTLFS